MERMQILSIGNFKPVSCGFMSPGVHVARHDAALNTPANTVEADPDSGYESVLKTIYTEVETRDWR